VFSFSDSAMLNSSLSVMFRFFRSRQRAPAFSKIRAIST